MSLKPALLFGLALLLLNGCAAYRNMTRQEDCDKVLKAYSRMLRWNEMEKAALLYVDQQQQETYSRNAEALRRRSITMADMRFLPASAAVIAKQRNRPLNLTILSCLTTG